ncbi:MFS transporter [Saccharomonospora cyanea]|uniref:Sugar phosphate permease n=1 Tax=Saccharomonospora cyanea NA-134 TaxID=882082 RepID=H5XHC8_9PSEU|nr:MFS transporter [Saccharomonospora cyanea]EHR60613.1 sugar phosphate permease [Saccharomonospora cyanea NA-134]
MRNAGVIWLLAVVELVVFLDTTVINVALPSIGADLGLDEAGLGWVVNSYLLAFGGFLLVGGRAADMFGARRAFVAGLVLFTIASAVAGLAQTAWLLVAARALQGVGAAVVIPAQLALIARTYSDPEDNRKAFGVWSAMGAAGAAIGTAAGGPLTEFLGWPSIFLINVPVGVVALALTGAVLSGDPPVRVVRLDVSGAVTATAGLLLAGYALGGLAEPGQSALTWLLLGLAVVLLVVFVVLERRLADDALVPLRLFRVREVSGSTAVNVLVGAAHVPVFALLALYLQGSQGYGPTQAGLAVLPVALVNIAASRTVIPAMVRRFGHAGTLAVGLALQAAAMGWLARLPEHVDYLVDVLPAAVLLGFGLPAAFVGVTAPAVNAVAESDRGVVGGVVNTAQRVGSGIGVAALLALAGSVGGTVGLRVSFAASAGLAVLGCVLTLAVLRTPQREAGPVAR